MSPRLIQYIKVSPFITAALLCTDGVSIPLFALLVAGFLLLFIPARCPRCGKRVDYNRTEVFLEGWGYTFCVPRKYSACRYPLSGWLDRVILSVDKKEDPVGKRCWSKSRDEYLGVPPVLRWVPPNVSMVCPSRNLLLPISFLLFHEQEVVIF